VFVAVTVTCVAAWLLMRSAANVERLLPKTLMGALGRIMGLLLAAVRRRVRRRRHPRHAASAVTSAGAVRGDRSEQHALAGRQSWRIARWRGSGIRRSSDRATPSRLR